MRASLWTTGGLRNAISRIADAFIETRHVKAGAITDAKLRDSVPYSVLGATTVTGPPADITASNPDEVLRMNATGDALGFGTVATGGLANSAVTNAKQADMVAGRIKGRQISSGTGAPEDMTAAQVRTSINVADGANAYVHPNHSGDVTSVADGAQTIVADAVTNTKLANMAAGTVKGSVAGGDPSDLTTIPTATVPAFTGDVTSAGGALALTIAADAVTNAKLADMTDATIKGRASGAGTGNPTDLTAAQVQAIVGTRSPLNLLVNGSFAFAQRQAPGTLTTYSNTTGRTYGPDYWTITNENASAQFQNVDTAASPVTGITARYYGNFKKITSTGKVIVSQVVECEDVMQYRGRTVYFQMRALNGVGSHTLRMVLLQLTSSGTFDTIPGTFVSAFGAASTDPTWGTNLSAITPSTANAACSISGAGLSCVLSSTPTVFGGTFAIPSNCLNLIAVIFTDGQPVANDIFAVTEVGIYDGSEERAWLPYSTQKELARVQRRCWKTFTRGTAPAQAAGVNTGEFRWACSTAGASTLRSPRVQYPVPMRSTAPTVTSYNPTSSSAQPRDQVAGADCTAFAVANQTEVAMNLTCTGAAGTSAGNPIGVHLLVEDSI